MGIRQDKSKPMVLYIAVAVIGGILALYFAQGKLQNLNIVALCLLIISISLIIWLFVYSPFGKWLNRWLMKSYDDVLKSVESDSRKKREENK